MYSTGHCTECRVIDERFHVLDVQDDLKRLFFYNYRVSVPHLTSSCIFCTTVLLLNIDQISQSAVLQWT